MNLDLPVVTETLGPLWAAQLNEALEILDEHDHASIGKQIPTAGLNINANLDFNGYKPFDLLSTQYTSQLAALTGATNANSVYVSGGNLYYTNGSGTAVQITNGGALVSTPGTTSSFEYDTINTNITISPSDTYVFIATDTSAARTITLPLASAVVEGRIYMIKDVTGNANANNITIAVSGSDAIDGGTSYAMDSGYGSISVISDGVSKWSTF